MIIPGARQYITFLNVLCLLFCAGITFGWNVTEQIIEIEVLPDDERNEMREAFTVHITMDENMIADVQVSSPDWSFT